MEILKTGAFIRSGRKKPGLTRKEPGKKLSVTDGAAGRRERDSEHDGAARERAKCLILAEERSDFTDVLESCGDAVTRMTPKEAVGRDLTGYDSFCVLAYGKVLDPRLRVRLEEEAAKGKRIFTEALSSFLTIYSYSEQPEDTTRRRLVVVQPEKPASAIPGLETGDLLDDMGNAMMQPSLSAPAMTPLLIYREHVIAHRHFGASREEILKDGKFGLWTVGENVMMSSFTLHNFNKARFAPRESWRKLIEWIAEWITGAEPSYLPEPVVRYGTDADLTDDGAFDECRKDAVERGIRWLGQFLVDEGAGGVREGIRHTIDPEGRQATADGVRNDCTGETAGAFRFYARLKGDGEADRIADRMQEFCFGTMMIRGGMLDGMMRWCDTQWNACYQDDVARAILPVLFECLFMGKNRYFTDACRALDFLVRTTAKDGCRVSRTDVPNLTEDSIRALAEAEHGIPTAHHNAYYHAALLLAYRIGGNPVYLDTARRGIETIMAVYPETRREQSETQEFCRLILPLACLCEATGEEKHRAMLDRVTRDLLTHRWPTGGYLEWDTGYTAHYSRESRSECSLLTENGDPVADLLYSVNWLPVGFAYAYHATGDPQYRDLWRDAAAFCLKTQIRSDDPLTDGSWCRAFDLELGEAYGCPHDVGWAACCSETGWTDAEILMGLMLPDIIAQSEKEQ